jgi:hypothetical protein
MRLEIGDWGLETGDWRLESSVNSNAICDARFAKTLCVSA